MLLFRQPLAINKQLILRPHINKYERSLMKNKCIVFNNNNNCKRCFGAAATNRISYREKVEKFVAETTLPDGSRVPGWETLNINGPSKMGHKKTGRKQARRKLAGPAMMRWYKPKMEEVMDRVWPAEMFRKANPNYYNSKKYIDFPDDPDERELYLFPHDPRVEFISRAKQIKIDRMDRRKRAGKGTPKKGQGKRSGKKK